ncbi:hypothetical protein BCR34DRAFT_620814 [Clohesyomyces aquaticus]|uniref:Uncharacterized protein n=1 Tax=Clohesyomyces aquaticus TaxID=1231657 RepID=A0A1Y2AB96_9PLEO|nr:hypothetical protein BCR34DRAFT_620814 [Clohesyomyces aquaticus]
MDLNKSPLPQHPLKRSRSSQSPSPSAKWSRTTPSTKPVQFLIISGTHNSELASHPECDVVLKCGDVTEDGSPASISATLQSIAKINAELKLCGSEVNCQESLSLVQGPDPEASNSGITFLEEGTNKFTLKSGASFTVYASPYMPKYGPSAFQYASREDRYNPPTALIILEGIGIVMTHGPPQYILERTSDGRSAGCEHLRRAIAGQNHECTALGWVGKNQAKRKGYACLSPGATEAFKSDESQTLMVNAAIMGGHSEPVISRGL